MREVLEALEAQEAAAGGGGDEDEDDGDEAVGDRAFGHATCRRGSLNACIPPPVQGCPPLVARVREKVRADLAVAPRRAWEALMLAVQVVQHYLLKKAEEDAARGPNRGAPWDIPDKGWLRAVLIRAFHLVSLNNPGRITRQVRDVHNDMWGEGSLARLVDRAGRKVDTSCVPATSILKLCAQLATNADVMVRSKGQCSLLRDLLKAVVLQSLQEQNANLSRSDVKVATGRAALLFFVRRAPGGGADDRGDGGGDAQRGVLLPGDDWLGEDGLAGRVRRACPRLERAVLALRDRLCTDHPACLPFPLPAPGGAPQPPALHHRLYLRLRLLQMIEACGGYRAGIKRRALLPLPGFARRFMPLPARALLEVFRHAVRAVHAVTREDLRFVLDFFSSRWRAEAGEAVRAREIARVRAHEAVRATAARAAARPGRAQRRAVQAAASADDALQLAREASQEAAVQAARTAADEAVVAARDAEAAAVRARDAARPVAAVADAPPSLAEADAAAVSARASVDASSRVVRALAAMASPLAPHTADAVLARLERVARIGRNAADAADRAVSAACRAAQQASADASAWEVLLADEVGRRRARPFTLFAMAATLAAVRDGAAAEAAARATRVRALGAAANEAVTARHAADRAAAAVSAAVQAGPGASARTCTSIQRAAGDAVRITWRVIQRWGVAAPPPPPRPPGGPAVLDAYFADIIAALTQADDGPPLSDAAQAARDALEEARRARGQARRRAVDVGHRGRGGPPGRDVRPHPPAAARADVADDLTLDASANLFAWRLLAYAHGPTFTGETGSTYFALSAATDGKSINVRMVKRRRGGPSSSGPGAGITCAGAGGLTGSSPRRRRGRRTRR